MSFRDEFKIGDRFNYLGTEMIVVELSMLGFMKVHYMSGIGELKEHKFEPDECVAIVKHIRDTEELVKGYRQAIEESQ